MQLAYRSVERNCSTGILCVDHALSVVKMIAYAVRLKTFYKKALVNFPLSFVRLREGSNHVEIPESGSRFPVAAMHHCPGERFLLLLD